MKNAKQMMVIALLATTIAAANAATEEKSNVTTINKVLPASLPVLEGPAPQKVVSVNETPQKTAAQKASLVELKFKSAQKN